MCKQCCNHWVADAGNKSRAESQLKPRTCAKISPAWDAAISSQQVEPHKENRQASRHTDDKGQCQGRRGTAFWIYAILWEIFDCSLTVNEIKKHKIIINRKTTVHIQHSSFHNPLVRLRGCNRRGDLYGYIQCPCVGHLWRDKWPTTTDTSQRLTRSVTSPRCQHDNTKAPTRLHQGRWLMANDSNSGCVYRRQPAFNIEFCTLWQFNSSGRYGSTTLIWSDQVTCRTIWRWPANDDVIRMHSNG